jgi:hypothetical protein
MQGKNFSSSSNLASFVPPQIFKFGLKLGQVLVNGFSGFLAYPLGARLECRLLQNGSSYLLVLQSEACVQMQNGRQLTIESRIQTKIISLFGIRKYQVAGINNGSREPTSALLMYRADRALLIQAAAFDVLQTT